MAEDKVRITIIADDKFSNAMKRATTALGKLDSSAKRTTIGINKFGGAIIVVNQALELLQKLARAVVGPLNSILETTDKFRRMEIALTSLTGSITEARTSMESLREISQKLPFTLETITNTFVRLRSTGVKDTERVMLGLVNAIAAFGGADEELKLAALAIQQMAGKGVISMEELRRQLGERIPTAIRIMARELGLSLPQLFEKVQSGALESFEGIEALTRGFEKDFKGAAERMLNSWRGATIKFKDAWDQFLRAIGETGFLQFAIDTLNSLTVELRNIGSEIKIFQLAIDDLLESSIIFQTVVTVLLAPIQAIKFLADQLGNVLGKAYKALTKDVRDYIEMQELFSLENTPEVIDAFADMITRTKETTKRIKEGTKAFEKFSQEGVLASIDDLVGLDAILVDIAQRFVNIKIELRKSADEGFKDALNNALEESTDLLVGFDATLVEVGQELINLKIKLQELADKGFKKALQKALEGSIDDLDDFQSKLVDAQKAADKLDATLKDFTKEVAIDFGKDLAGQITGGKGAIAGFELGAAGAVGGPIGALIGATLDLIISNSETQKFLGELNQLIDEVLAPVMREILAPIMQALKPALEDLALIMEDLAPIWKALGLVIKSTLLPLTASISALKSTIDFLTDIDEQLVKAVRILTDVIDKISGFFGGGGGFGLGGDRGLLGGGIIPGFLHEGGTIQQKHLTRLPGMRPDEGLAVLQEGETVVPRGGTTGSVIINVRAINPKESAQEIRTVIEEMQVQGLLA